MIKQLTNFPDNVLAFVCEGHVTKKDYDVVLVPAVEDALKRHPKARLFYETAPNFTGMDPGAMWQDFRESIAHFRAWEKVAIVSDVDWIRNAVKLSSIVMPGEVKLFPTAHAAQARDWLLT